MNIYATVSWCILYCVNHVTIIHINRVKGLQPITKTAKDKQVEKLEEQYNKQKKGMEGKIVELESELEENLNTYVRTEVL